MISYPAMNERGNSDLIFIVMEEIGSLDTVV